MSRVQPLRQRPAAARRSLPPTPAATLGFRGTTALIQLAPAAPVAAVLYDGFPLPADRWRVGTDAELAVTCPPSAFDSAAHALRLEFALPGLPPCELRFRSEYRGAIEFADESSVRGWVYDTLRPGSALVLNVTTGTGSLQVRTTAPRPELQAAEPDVIGGGFALTLPPRPAASTPDVITITVAGTSHMPFSPILRGATLPAAIAAAAAAGRSLGQSAAGLLFGTVLLPLLAAAGGGAGLPDVLRLPGPRHLPRPSAPQIDVIVPVYRGEAETLACLASVLDGGNTVPHRLVVIDDCSPEPALTAALQEMAAAGRIHYVRNDRNLGFVASVNRGMALSATADVLLLNADTVAPPGLLDRLCRAAASDPAIATVTPLSNNATAYSLPAPPGSAADPWGLPADAIDALCRTVNAGSVRDIPTAHGFCMFIRRAALDDVGPFDAESFGTGYGEENDFSLRALLRGWRNVCAADVYVRHIGVVSFTASAGRDAQLAANLRTVEARHPFYAAFVADFLRTDPLHDLRNNVQKAIWRRHPRIAVFVTLALAGGAARHAADMMDRLAAEDWLVLALSTEPDAGGTPRLTLRQAGTDEALRYPATVAQEAVLADILDLAPRFLHVQHLIDLPDGIAAFVRDSGIAYAVTLHDFFYGCPKVTLLDAGNLYCGMPPAARCTSCVRQGPIHADVHPTLAPYAEAGETWRGHWEGLLREAAQVIAPSHDTATRYAALFPGLCISVRPHFAPRDRPAGVPQPATADGTKLRVALPGALGPQKGARELLQLARHCSRWHDDIEFVVIGYSDREEELRRHDNILVHGGYAPRDAVAALAASGCQVALLLNVFPETFSYTLSESVEAGLVPVAYDFGAIGERMRALGVGVLVPPRAAPEQIVAALRQAAQRRAEVPVTALYGQYRRLMTDYYAPALVDLAEAAPPPDLPRLLGRPHGLHPDGWCEATVSLRLWSARKLTRFAFGLWVPTEGQFQAVEIACDGARLTRSLLEPGAVCRIVCTRPDGGTQLTAITLRFDFAFPLRPPDVRACAGMLSSLQVSDGSGWHTIELPAAARPGTDATMAPAAPAAIRAVA